MANDETPNPSTTEQCREEEDEQEEPAPETLTLPDADSTIPDQDPDTLTEDLTLNLTADDPEPDAPTAATSLRRAHKRKKPGPKRTAQEKKSRQKLPLLIETLIPIPFVPSKAFDFDSHKSLLQRLGLWDFAHLDFGPALRRDLIAELIAGYVPGSRCSYVSGYRIRVSRADLSRALKLPKKNAAAVAAVVAESGEELVDSRESIAFVYEFASNWMLLHDDTYIMPEEVLGYMTSIREGNWERVDWAHLIWLMVEKELSAPKLGGCYYASHLQQLIKSQHKQLLEEEPLLVVEEEVEVKDEGEEVEVKDEGEEVEVKDEGEEVEVKDEGEEVEVEVKDEGEEDEVKDEGEEAELKGEGGEAELKDEGGEFGVRDEGENVEVEAKDEKEEDDEEVEEVDGNGDVKMGGVDVDESRVHELEEPNFELCLGQDNVERDEVENEQGVEEERVIMDFEQVKEEESGMWLMDHRNNAGDPFLRQCRNVDVKGMGFSLLKEEEEEDGQEQEEEDEDEEEDDHEGGFNLSPKCNPFQGMSSGTGSIIHAMDAVQMPFSSGIDLRDDPAGDFLSSRDDPQMIAGSSLFGNGHKRDIGLMDNHNSHHFPNVSNKRMRSDSPWNSKPVDFEMCMEQMEHVMGKARMFYASKEQAAEESAMNQQLLLNELQKRDNEIDRLHKAKIEESQRRQMEMYRLEKELYMMQSLVEGYRKALKETQKAFAEYRARCPQADEPLYKDVPGSGGLVLSVAELEKERLKKEEEERAIMKEVERKCGAFELIYLAEFEGHMSIVESFNDRLIAMENQVKHLKEVKAKSKVAVADTPTPECAPTSEAQTA